MESTTSLSSVSCFSGLNLMPRLCSRDVDMMGDTRHSPNHTKELVGQSENLREATVWDEAQPATFG